MIRVATTVTACLPALECCKSCRPLSGPSPSCLVTSSMMGLTSPIVNPNDSRYRCIELLGLCLETGVSAFSTSLPLPMSDDGREGREYRIETDIYTFTCVQLRGSTAPG